MADYFQPIVFWGALYDAWMTPKSEGGLGPENAREVLGIEAFHHYGVTTHEAVAGTAAGEVIYGLVRSTWHKPREDGGGLHDDDHTWDFKDPSAPGGRGRVQIYKTEKAGYWAFNPYGVADGPGARWFDQEYRVPTVGELLAEAAYCEAKIVEHGNEMLRCRDTVRGRKSIKNLKSLIEDREWRRKMVLKRWPQTSIFLDAPLTAPAHLPADRLDITKFSAQRLESYPIIRALLGDHPCATT
ncbi:hypothetical protein HOU02_gp344 [Caulobacter phage CcrBL9]|uniref:Uncharacterized protein n=1 Tax=Caulobacter phage CcrBL9 TaxID=2283270 RepID=A0A385EBW8_9CAUD|nr:hypothetical protein HOU02_gp344 [Caulobacter phage CcrBL9]AXQ69381.1 hypothetical protein CcrBL9_gp357 [Caulobacter phage CcrBL9]